MDITHGVIIFFAGFCASIFGTLVGGSSLVTIPTLLLLGVSPHTAIGTDRFGIMGVCAAGWYQFHKKGLVNYRVGITLAIPVLFGSFIGANLVFEISESILKLIIITVSLVCLGFLLLNPNFGVGGERRKTGWVTYTVGAAMTFVVGIYVGFYGAMGGTLLMYILILWFGQSFLESAGTLKIAALAMNGIAAIVFAFNGAVNYHLALPMFFGCSIGSMVGGHYAERIGNVWIRRLFLVLLAALILKLII
jgi:uncharacterized protein